jgi:hypothetical protein
MSHALRYALWRTSAKQLCGKYRIILDDLVWRIRGGEGGGEDAVSLDFTKALHEWLIFV